MEELSIPHFRKLLTSNVKILQKFCRQWEKISSDTTIPEDVGDEIRTTIGLTKLLLAQKLSQFGGLIDDSELKRGEKEITCVDLQGFWDMVYHQVENIHNGFKRLEDCQKNNWIFVEEVATKVVPKKKPAISAVVKAKSSGKDLASAARQRIAEAKLKMKAKMLNAESSEAETSDICAEGPSTKDAASQLLVNGKPAVEEQPTTLQDIQNVKIVEGKSQSAVKTARSKKVPEKTPTRKEAAGSKTKNIKNKENVSSEKVEATKLKVENGATGPAIKPSGRKRQPPKDFIPLQCVTRSAAKRQLMNDRGASK